MVEIILMCVLGKETGFVLILCVAILTLQGGISVTTVISLVMHLLEVLGGLILVHHLFMCHLDASLALQLIVHQKGYRMAIGLLHVGWQGICPKSMDLLLCLPGMKAGFQIITCGERGLII